MKSTQKYIANLMTKSSGILYCSFMDEKVIKTFSLLEGKNGYKHFCFSPLMNCHCGREELSIFMKAYGSIFSECLQTISKGENE